MINFLFYFDKTILCYEIVWLAFEVNSGLNRLLS